MTSEKWQIIWQICEGARQRPVAERLAYVRLHSPDEEVEREALSLLEEPEESVFPSWGLSGDSAQSTGEGGTTLAAVRSLAGLRIGRYVVGEAIGYGASGDVYAARDSELERAVAMKFLKPGMADARWKVDRLLREAKAASALNHPGIITVYEVIQSESGLAIVMEFVDGTPLRRLCGVANPIDRIIRCGSQIAGALATAHERGIIHRDIKPENIMVRADGLVKVLDFGLAQFLSRLDDSLTTNMRVGTLRYMSPEQARGERLTPATDVFSLGLILYEMAAGRHPHSADNVVDTIRAIAADTPLPPSAFRRDIPKPLEDLIMEMLAKDPLRRPSAADVARRLSTPVQPASRSRRSLWPVAATLAAAATLLGAAFLTTRSTHKPASPIFLKAVPVTATTGYDTWPDISPDGQAVVYGWSETPDSYTHLYLKRFDQDAPIKLVEAEPPARIGHPRWSPDGQRIYYKRTVVRDSEDGIWSVSADGRERKKVVSVRAAELSSGIDCSPDGRRLVYSDLGGERDPRFYIHSYDLATGEVRVLTTPSGDGWGDWDPRFSPDGKSVVFKRVKLAGADNLYIVPSTGGEQRQVTFERHSIVGHNWLPDGKLLLSSQIGSVVHGLWLVTADGSGKPQSVFESGLDAKMPSAGANKVVWVNEVNDHNIYTVPTTGGTAVKRIASPVYDSRPAFARDGRLAYVSRRSGSPEIWISNADGSNASRITNLKGNIGRPDWSPDGSRIVFSMQRAGVTRVFSSKCTPGELRCDPPAPLFEGANPSWSADGRFLYFASRQQNEIFKIPAAGGTPVRVAAGFLTRASPDGKWLYIARVAMAGAPGFHRIRLDATGTETGPEELVLNRSNSSAGLQHWALAGDEIIYWDKDIFSKFSGLRAYHTVTKRTRTIIEARAAEYPAVSPDGREILYSQADAAGGTLMVAEWGR